VTHYRLMSIFPPYLHQVAIGLLLSDGSIERPTRTGGARLSVILGINSLPYLLHLYNLFEPYIDSGFSISEVSNKKTGKSYDTARFQTGMMPIFVNYHDMFYYYDEVAQRYIKRVPENIDSLMTPVVLANLIMGDGNLKGSEGIIRIYTNSFTRLEVCFADTKWSCAKPTPVRRTYAATGQGWISL
jgi:LAGLIDADG DNA endonuclease family